MKTQKEDKIQPNPNSEILLRTELSNLRSDFKSDYENFKCLVTVEERYLNGMEVGDSRLCLFNNGNAIVYSLVSKTQDLDKDMLKYVIEIQQHLPKLVLEAIISGYFPAHSIQSRQKIKLGDAKKIVDRADRIHFLVEFGLAIAFVSVMLTPKIVSGDALPEMKNNCPISEQQLLTKPPREKTN